MKKRVIDFNGKRFIISFPYDVKVKDELKMMVEGRVYNAKEQVWECPLSSYQSLEKFAETHGFSFTEEAERRLREQRELAQQSKQFKSHYEVKTIKKPIINGVEADLYPYQKAGVEYCVRAKKAIIADEMGLGKTVQAIATVMELKALPFVVVCPNSLKQNWKREIEMWGGLRVQVINAGEAAHSGVDAWVVNYDILSRYVSFLAAYGNGIVFDESHRLKSSKTNRYEAAKALVKDKEVVLLLTGTPVQNRPYELVSQLSLIGRLEEFGGWYRFVKRYCGGGYGYAGSLQTDGASNVKELNEKLRSICMVRREKRDVLTELPKMTRSKVVFDARGSIYNRVLNEVLLLDKVGMVEIDALRRASALEKIPFAIDFIEDIIDEGESVVLFAHHKEVIEQLRCAIEAKFKFSPCVITGETPSVRRQTVVDMFQKGEVPVIICSMMAAGEGITLTRSSKVCFMEIGWHYSVHAQCEARVDRIGQRYPTTAYYFISSGTTDETDFEKFILEKGEIASMIASGISLLEFFNLKSIKGKPCQNS